MHFLTRTALGVTAAGVAGVGYAAGIERLSFRLRRVDVPVLAPGANPIRVLHLSDLHLTPGQARKRDWVRALADLQPDFVIDTGDNLAHLQAVPMAMRTLEPLLELPGAFVLGSNDYYAPRLKNPAAYLMPDRGKRKTGVRLPTDDLVAGLRSAGWVDLNNARARVSVGGLDLELVGVDDPHLSRDRYETVAGQADPEADLTLGVTHAPYVRVLDAMVRDGARLVVAGHTHGGQLCIPGYGALVTNCDLDRHRVKGLSRWWPGAGLDPRSALRPAPSHAAWLQVSAGLGTSPYAPVRFACPPEATLMTLGASG
ncbi:MAG: metallophosphoesterase [Actinomycetota bacterium]|nr:metallophosphoesterase [Actinomycetota bacterium]